MCDYASVYICQLFAACVNCLAIFVTLSLSAPIHSSSLAPLATPAPCQSLTADTCGRSKTIFCNMNGKVEHIFIHPSIHLYNHLSTVNIASICFVIIMMMMMMVGWLVRCFESSSSSASVTSTQLLLISYPRSVLRLAMLIVWK